jgi:hypothetical protein
MHTALQKDVKVPGRITCLKDEIALVECVCLGDLHDVAGEDLAGSFEKVDLVDGHVGTSSPMFENAIAGSSRPYCPPCLILFFNLFIGQSDVLPKQPVHDLHRSFFGLAMGL